MEIIDLFQIQAKMLLLANYVCDEVENVKKVLQLTKIKQKFCVVCKMYLICHHHKNPPKDNHLSEYLL